MLTLLSCLTISIQTFAHDPATEMAAAAKNFLNSLDDKKKRKHSIHLRIKKEKIGISFLAILFNQMGEWDYP